MDWRRVDERLIRAGELLLSLDFLEGYELELSLLNDSKVGRPLSLRMGMLCSSLSSVIYSLCPIGRLRASLERLIGSSQGFPQSTTLGLGGVYSGLI